MVLPYADDEASEEAFEAVMCAAHFGKYYEFQEEIFHSSWWGTTDYQHQAEDAGISDVAFLECLQSDTFAQAAANSVATANQFGITSAPGFLINGAVIDWQSYDDDAVSEALQDYFQ